MIRGILRLKHPEIYIPPQGDLTVESRPKPTIVRRIVDVALSTCDTITKEAAEIKAEKQLNYINDQSDNPFAHLND